MNSPADSVEFYATNQSCRNGLSEEDLKAFTEVKKKKSVTYTKGRSFSGCPVQPVRSGKTLCRSDVLTMEVATNKAISFPETAEL